MIMQNVSANTSEFKNASFGYAMSFEGNSSYTNEHIVDEFIKKFDEAREKEKKGNFLSKYMWSQTAAYAVTLPLLLYEGIIFFKRHNLKNAGKPDEAKRFIKKSVKNFAWIIPSCIGGFAGIQYLLAKNNDKNFEKVKQQFNDINTDTSAMLDEETFASGYIGGIYSAGSNKIKINKTYVNDPLSRTRLKNIFKHELIHAKQSELVACSTDGIKKLNYATMYNLARVVKHEPDTFQEIEQIYDKLEEDTEGKYDNTKLFIYSLEFNLKDFIKTLHILINNSGATYNDIPMCIDEEHYLKVVAEKGKLTPEEETKANEYYKAFMDYTAPKNFINAYNPFSSYRKNKLEKEAYKR